MRNDRQPVPEMLTVSINNTSVSVARGTSVAAAVAIAGQLVTRLSVTGMPRAPLCGMGVCQECRVSIDGRAHQLSCQTPCAPGMQVRTAQHAVSEMSVLLQEATP